MSNDPDRVFRPVFFFVSAVTLLCGVSAGLMTFYAPPEPSDAYADMVEMFADTFKFCVAAVVGMIGGRSLR
jgi:hypothetical protein